MDKFQISFELTKVAIEKDIIKFEKPKNAESVNIESTNTFNSKQISDFYNNILSEFKTV